MPTGLSLGSHALARPTHLLALRRGGLLAPQALGLKLAQQAQRAFHLVLAGALAHHALPARGCGRDAAACGPGHSKFFWRQHRADLLAAGQQPRQHTPRVEGRRVQALQGGVPKAHLICWRARSTPAR